jgi:hypothetical protein
MRVFVVWVPVLKTDWEMPGRAVLAHISDPRAREYWDKQLIVSHQARRALQNDSESADEIVWDFVAVYAPGIRWDETFPIPSFQGAPVVEVIGSLQQYLSQHK